MSDKWEGTVYQGHLKWPPASFYHIANSCTLSQAFAASKLRATIPAATQTYIGLEELLDKHWITAITKRSLVNIYQITVISFTIKAKVLDYMKTGVRQSLLADDVLSYYRVFNIRVNGIQPSPQSALEHLPYPQLHISPSISTDKDQARSKNAVAYCRFGCTDPAVLYPKHRAVATTAPPLPEIKVKVEVKAPDVKYAPLSSSYKSTSGVGGAAAKIISAAGQDKDEQSLFIFQNDTAEVEQAKGEAKYRLASNKNSSCLRKPTIEHHDNKPIAIMRDGWRECDGQQK